MTRLLLKRSASALSTSPSSSSPSPPSSSASASSRKHIHKKSRTSRSKEDRDYEEDPFLVPPLVRQNHQNVPDRIVAVQKAQIRAGRKVELKLDDLLRTKFHSVDVALNFVPEINETERHYIPQPCPKVWKKKGLRTAMSGTAESHLAILKELKKGNTITQVNACVLGKLTDPTTGERVFFTNYMLVVRLLSVEGPNVILPFEVTIVTSHNGGNNTSRIDIPRSLSLPYKDVEANSEARPAWIASAFPAPNNMYAEIILPELTSPFSEEGNHYYDYNNRKVEITPEPESPTSHTVTLLVEEDTPSFSSPHSFLLEEEEEVESGSLSLPHPQAPALTSSTSTLPLPSPSSPSPSSSSSSSSSFEPDNRDIDSISVEDLLSDWVHIPRDEDIGCSTSVSSVSSSLNLRLSSTSIFTSAPSVMECVF